MDPRISQQLIETVDTRFDQLSRSLPYTAYGVVSAVDTTNHRVSVFVSGDAVASDGFYYKPGMLPGPGSRVRVVIDPRGDRYVDEVLNVHVDGGLLYGGPSRYVRNGGTRDILNGLTTTSNIAQTVVETTLIPPNVVQAIYMQILLKSTTAPINDARFTCQAGGAGLGTEMTCYLQSTPNRIIALNGVVKPDGTNHREISYDFLGLGFGTLTYWLRVFGWWTID